jgi:hypothetical protein
MEETARVTNKESSSWDRWRMEKKRRAGTVTEDGG